MITAQEAAKNANAFDKEANFKKIADNWIEDLQNIIKYKSEKGELSTHWAPCISPEKYPSEVFIIIEKTLEESGFTFVKMAKGLYDIRWG